MRFVDNFGVPLPGKLPKIELKYFDTTFDIEFKSRKTVVIGDSGTGKSLLFNLLRQKRTQLQLMPANEITDADEVILDCVLVNIESSKEELKQLYTAHDKLIVIDNGDLLINTRELQEHLYDNMDNCYLVFARSGVKVTSSRKSYAYLRRKDNIIFLSYLFEELYK